MKLTKRNLQALGFTQVGSAIPYINRWKVDDIVVEENTKDGTFMYGAGKLRDLNNIRKIVNPQEVNANPEHTKRDLNSLKTMVYQMRVYKEDIESTGIENSKQDDVNYYSFLKRQCRQRLNRINVEHLNETETNEFLSSMQRFKDCQL